MSNSAQSIATPVVRGLLAALTALGIAIAVVVVPALAAQVAGTASTATALDAIVIALNFLILGHGGGIVLTTGVVDGAVTLTPIGLLILLLALSATTLRGVGRKLVPVRDDGMLRHGALRDLGVALGAYAAAYASGLAVLAAMGRSADTSPLVPSALVSGVMVAVLGGLTGLLWSLRRDPTDELPGVRVLDLLPSPYGEVARAALIALATLLSLGLATMLVLILLALPAQAALFEQLQPGIIGGIVLALLQLALLPLLAIWALVVLVGGTVGVGTGTAISLDGAQTGVLPALPMLGALPGPGEFPAAAWALMLLPAIAVGLGAVRLVRDVAELEQRDRLTAWIAYPLVIVVALLLIAGLSGGGIGEDRLAHVGPQVGTMLLPLLGIAVLGAGAVYGVLGTPLIPWTRRAVDSLRERVERAEQEERGESPREQGTAATAGDGADGAAESDARSASGSAGPDTDDAADTHDAGVEANPGEDEEDLWSTADVDSESADEESPAEDQRSAAKDS